MLGRSRPEYIFIRTTVFILQNSIPISLLGLALLNPFTLSLLPSPPSPSSWLPRLTLWTSRFLALNFLADTTLLLTLYLPFTRRSQRPAAHPLPRTTREDREALFAKVVANMPNPERYLRQWFLGAPLAEIREENLREFLLWAFFDIDAATAEADDLGDEIEDELALYIGEVGLLLGSRLERGRGEARSLRLTMDPVEARFRPLLWYATVGLVDGLTHLHLRWHGFEYRAVPSWRRRLAVFPPRPLTLLPSAKLQKPASQTLELSYWHRPHTAKKGLPIVFIHGIGIGLWPYRNFLAEIAKFGSDDPDLDGEIGIIALELLPISSRLTGVPLDRPTFLEQMAAILAQHGWDKFVLVSHSYGSVLTTHMVRTPTLGPRIDAVMLIDPVTLLLQLPSVAYNFTRRPPNTANEWQLWYFASTDPATSRTLGRHLFWRESLVWKEELTLAFEDGARQRQVAVCLSDQDLIVDTETVRKYLSIRGDFKDMDDDDFGEIIQIDLEDGEGLPELEDSREQAKDAANGVTTTRSGIEVIMMRGLDHAQVFDDLEACGRIFGILRKYCRTPSS